MSWHDIFVVLGHLLMVWRILIDLINIKIDR